MPLIAGAKNCSTIKSTPLWCQKRTEVLSMPWEWCSCFLCSGEWITSIPKWGNLQKKNAQYRTFETPKRCKARGHCVIVIFNAAEVYTNTRQQTNAPRWEKWDGCSKVRRRSELWPRMTVHWTFVFIRVTWPQRHHHITSRLVTQPHSCLLAVCFPMGL